MSYCLRWLQQKPLESSFSDLWFHLLVNIIVFCLETTCFVSVGKRAQAIPGCYSAWSHWQTWAFLAVSHQDWIRVVSLWSDDQEAALKMAGYCVHWHCKLRSLALVRPIALAWVEYKKPVPIESWWSMNLACQRKKQLFSSHLLRNVCVSQITFRITDKKWCVILF